MGAKPPIFISQDQYIPKKSMRFQDQSSTRSTSSASAEALIFFCLLFLYQDKKRRQGHGGKAPDFHIPKSIYPENVIRFQDQSCTRSTSTASVEALIFFCLLFFHQGKKRRQGHGGKVPDFYIPRSIYPKNVIRFRIIRSLYPKNEPRFHHSSNMNIQNVVRFLVIRSLYPKNVSRFAHLPSLGCRPVWRMQYAPT